MNGQELKHFLQGLGVRQADLAKKMGTSQQNLSSIFKAASVKTSRLEEIARALGQDISMFFKEEENAGNLAQLQALLRAKDEKIQELEATVQRLIGIIEKMQ